MTHAAIEFIDSQEWESAADALGFAPQQSRIIARLAQGKEDKQIAIQLNLSYSTVRTYVSRAFQKCGATGRLELAMLVHTRLMATRQQKQTQPTP